MRTFLAICCNVSEAKVRVIAPDVGGGFGGKLNAYAEEFIAAAVSRKLGAPVKWIEERTRRWWPPSTAAPRTRTWSSPPTKDGKILGLRAHYVRTAAPTCSC